MNLVHDVLDKQVMDRSRINMGRVDGIALELRDGEPPRLAYIELSGETAMRRLARWLGRLAASLRGVAPAAGGPTRIEWEHVTVIGQDIETDVVADETPALALELWLREHVVEKVPGS